MLSAEDSEIKDSLIDQLNRLPLVEIAPFTAAERRESAVLAFQILGTNAQSVYPTLLAQLDDSNCPASMPLALRAIRPADKKAMVQALNHSNPEVRRHAVLPFVWETFRPGDEWPT
jgi:hypothetical protein